MQIKVYMVCMRNSSQGYMVRLCLKGKRKWLGTAWCSVLPAETHGLLWFRAVFSAT